MLSRSSPDGRPGGTRSLSTLLVRRRGGAAVLGCYTAFLAWVLFWPSGRPASATVDHISSALYDVGLPTGLVTDSRVELALNALMIAPVPLLAAWVGARWSWERWTAYAFIASGTVELIQGIALSHRSAQFHDVVANTLGTLVGAFLSRLFVRWRHP